ncbi:MAG TPA: multidrug effflux MFS transporter [Savagea sp.]
MNHFTLKKHRGDVPSLLLLIVLVGFPQLSETILSPSLPSIGVAYDVMPRVAQMLMSVYFMAFALGVFVFGRWSDRIGRRPAMLIGLAIYALGNIVCWQSGTFSALLVGRSLQAFGASVGSIVTQTMLREAFTGTVRNVRFAQISAALAFTPALGPFIGGALHDIWSFRAVFLALVIGSVLLFAVTYNRLPETRTERKAPVALGPLIRRMSRDATLWRYAVLIGGWNGILFAYYTEAPFLFVTHFGLTPSTFGWLGIGVATATAGGAWASKRGHARHETPERLIQLGSAIVVCGALASYGAAALTGTGSFVAMCGALFLVLYGIGVALPNALAVALRAYQGEIGTAGALFSLVYYGIVSAVVYGMSVAHDGTPYAIARYFIAGSVVLYVVQHKVPSRE